MSTCPRLLSFFALYALVLIYISMLWLLIIDVFPTPICLPMLVAGVVARCFIYELVAKRKDCPVGTLFLVEAALESTLIFTAIFPQKTSMRRGRVTEEVILIVFGFLPFLTQTPILAIMQLPAPIFLRVWHLCIVLSLMHSTWSLMYYVMDHRPETWILLISIMACILRRPTRNFNVQWFINTFLLFWLILILVVIGDKYFLHLLLPSYRLSTTLLAAALWLAAAFKRELVAGYKHLRAGARGVMLTLLLGEEAAAVAMAPSMQ